MSIPARGEPGRDLTEFEKARAAGRLRPLGFIRGDASDEEIVAFADYLAGLVAGNDTLPSGIDGGSVLLEHEHSHEA